jgi:hypothetical protein
VDLSQVSFSTATPVYISHPKNAVGVERRLGGSALAHRRKPLKIVSCFVMTPDSPPKTISSMIDALERIREDLFHLQREMEKLEGVQELPSGDEHKT